MGLIVCKFGGTSLAGAAQLEAVCRIVRQNPQRRLIVASAPGRRFPGDTKLTDLLISGDTVSAQARLQQMADEAGTDVTVRLSDDSPMEFLASRGEYYCARILAHALGFHFIDAAELIRFDENGLTDLQATAKAIRNRLDGDCRAVIPGFYGSLPNGTIHTLPRGGSDNTGALIAAALQADCYENFTDVPGLFDCDPSLIPDARSVPFAAYDEVRLLAHCGASVLHEDAITPVQRAGVPIRLCSTFQPELPGTQIAFLPSDRAMISADCRGRCAIAGPLPKNFLLTLRRQFPFTKVTAQKGGLTFTLPLPQAEGVRLLRGMLQ